MEDILAALVIFGVVALFAYTVHKLVDWRTKKNEAENKRLDEIRDQLKQETERLRTRRLEQAVKNTPSVAKTEVKPTVKVSEPSKPSYAPSPTQSVQQSSDDGFMTGMVTGMLLNDMFSHKSEPSLGVTKTESSWGFDDSDSRKSISDSMDSSSSWSSSSSDSWSSSDSGPSSDW